MATEVLFAISGIAQPGYSVTYSTVQAYVAAEAGDLVTPDVFHTVVLFGENNQLIVEPGASDFSGFTTSALNDISILPEAAYLAHDYQESNMITVRGSVDGLLFDTAGVHLHLEGFVLHNTRNTTSGVCIDGSLTVLYRMILKASQPLSENLTTLMGVMECVLAPLDLDNGAYSTLFKGAAFNDNCAYYDLDFANQGGIQTITDCYAANWVRTNNGSYDYNAGLQNVPGTNAVTVVAENLVFVAGSAYGALASGDHRLWKRVTNPLYGAGTGGTNIGPSEAYYEVTHDSNTDGTLYDTGATTSTQDKMQEYHTTKEGDISANQGVISSTTKDQYSDFYKFGTISEPQNISGTAKQSEYKNTGDTEISVPVGLNTSLKVLQHSVIGGRISSYEKTEATTDVMESVLVSGDVTVANHIDSSVCAMCEVGHFEAEGDITETDAMTGIATQVPILDSDYFATGVTGATDSLQGARNVDIDGYDDFGESICLTATWNADVELEGEMIVCQP